MSKPFIPPSFSVPLNWFIDLMFPVLIKAIQNIDEVRISDEDKSRLRELRNERILFASNHPTTAEPPISFHIANLMGTRFNYMAARQVFDWDFGMTGKIISNIGAFSVIAGISDRESLKQARSILASKNGKLVLFPEGEPTSGENDSLMPFQAGIAQLGFWGLEDALKTDKDSDVTVLSCCMKYIVKAGKDEILEILNSKIQEIEHRFLINPGNKNLLRRFLSVGRMLLEHAEHDYKIPVERDKPWDYRIGRLRHTILDNVADELKIKNYDRKADAIIKLRQLIAVIELLSIEYPDPKLPPVSKVQMEWAKKEFLNAFDFIVINPEYLVTYPSPERFFEWLTRFETYIYQGKPRMLGGERPLLPRIAHVKFAKDFKLSEYRNEYKKDKRGAVESVTKRLRGDIQKILDEQIKLSQPLVKPFDIGDDAVGFNFNKK